MNGRTLKTLALLATLLLPAWAPSAQAACTVPNSFTNGAIADANQVNANFTGLKTCVETNQANITTNANSIASIQAQVDTVTTPLTSYWFNFSTSSAKNLRNVVITHQLAIGSMAYCNRYNVYVFYENAPATSFTYNGALPPVAITHIAEYGYIQEDEDSAMYTCLGTYSTAGNIREGSETANMSIAYKENWWWDGTVFSKMDDTFKSITECFSPSYSGVFRQCIIKDYSIATGVEELMGIVDRSRVRSNLNPADTLTISGIPFNNIQVESRPSWAGKARYTAQGVGLIQFGDEKVVWYRSNGITGGTLPAVFTVAPFQGYWFQ